VRAAVKRPLRLGLKEAAATSSVGASTATTLANSVGVGAAGALSTVSGEASSFGWMPRRSSSITFCYTDR
jgi:hypothetical protein